MESQKVSLAQNEKEKLLREFKQICWDFEPKYVLRSIISSNLSGWISLKLTTLMQEIGYNKRKIHDLAGRKIILNIGCLNITDNNYINGDLFPPVETLKQILNLISGKTKIEQDLFINITAYDKNLAEFADGIILSHVLEHIKPMLAITALKNCYAYLKPGGCIRLSVPCLAAYEQQKLPDCQNFENRMLAKNKLIYDYGHKFMYDAEILTLVMEEAGFNEIKEVTFKEGLLGETDLPHRQPESIYLTGIKN